MTERPNAHVVLKAHDAEVYEALAAPEVILRVEGQTMAGCGMPVRMLMYDAIAYARQVKALSKRNRREKRLRRGAEFLSGIKKEDRLIPVLSLVFYYGEDQDWDGALSLHDMLEFPEELKAYQKYFSDYRINLVSSRTVDSGSFHTGCRLWDAGHRQAKRRERRRLICALQFRN